MTVEVLLHLMPYRIRHFFPAFSFTWMILLLTVDDKEGAPYELAFMTVQLQMRHVLMTVCQEMC